MYCINCGQQIDDKAAVCIHCGVATKNVQAKKQSEETNNNMALIGFILSFFIAIAGLICSIIGLKKVNECGGKGKGFSIAGIIISILNMVSLFIYIIFYFVLIFSRVL